MTRFLEKTMRKRLFEIIEVSKENDKVSTAYDILMMITIGLSIVPLAFKESNTVFHCIDIVSVSLFILDYFFRLITADYKLENKGLKAFFLYPFTPWAIIDLLSILPAISFFDNSLKLLRLFRIFRVFKAFRYSKTINVIIRVMKKSKDALLAVLSLAVGYILVSALIIFNIEGDTFPSFFDAVYWATVSLTTVGYGDIYPVSTAGQIITMVSSLFGIAIVALPAGIITAGYMEELIAEKDENDEKGKEDGNSGKTNNKE